jgi:hypothetical protein
LFCQPAELGRSSGRFGQLVLEDGQWWAVAPLPGGVNNGAFSASGA